MNFIESSKKYLVPTCSLPQISSNSVLACLYSSEGSVMERHHFAQAMCILNTEGCNILENLGKADYTRCLDLIRDNILATDLAHHLRTLGDMEAMVAQVSTQYLLNLQSIDAISTQNLHRAACPPPAPSTTTSSPAC